MHQMQLAAPEKLFIGAPGADGNCNCNMCPYMGLNTMEKLYVALRDLQPQLHLAEDVRVAALKPLERMLAMSGGAAGHRLGSARMILAAFSRRRRGFTRKIDWLDSWHSFSFGHHHDPHATKAGLQRCVCDQLRLDHVRGRGSSAWASRREIVVYVLEGGIGVQVCRAAAWP